MRKELLNKIDEALKCNLVGETHFTSEEFSELGEYTASILRRYSQGTITSIGQEEEKILFVALINVVKEWKPGVSGNNLESSETFRNFAYRAMSGESGDIPNNVYLFINGVVKKVCKMHNITLFSCVKKYYATVLAHSLSPEQSIRAFLDLCWDIYLNDLGQNYVANDPIFLSIANQLKWRFSENKNLDEKFELSGSVYALRAGIKYLFVYDEERAVKFLDKSIFYINKIFEENNLKNNDNQIASLINKWWEKKLNSIKLSARKPRGDHVPVDRSHIFPRFRLLQEELILGIPAIRLEDNFYEKVFLRVYNDDNIIFEDVVDTLGTGLAMSTKYKDIVISNFLNEGENINIRVEIELAGKIIYDSKKTLFRDFLLFNGEKEIYSCEVATGEYFIFTTDIDAFNHTPQLLQDAGVYKYAISAESGETLHYNTKKVFFTNEKSSSRAWVKGNIVNNSIYVKDGQEYRIFSKYSGLTIKSEGKEKNNYVLKVNGEIVNIQTESDSILEEINVELDLLEFKPHSIEIFDLKSNKLIFARNVIIVHDCKCEFDRKYYYGDNSSGTFSFRYNDERLERDFQIDNTSEVSINLFDGKIVAVIPKIVVKFNEFSTTKLHHEMLWVGNINNGVVMTIEKPEDIDLSIWVLNHEVPATNGSSYAFGKTLNIVKEQDLKSGIVFFKTRDGIEKICEVAFSPIMLKIPKIDVNGSILEWNAEGCYVGPKDSSFLIEILDYKNKIILTSNLTGLVNRAYLMSKSADGTSLDKGVYKVRVSVCAKGFVKTNHIVKEFDYVIGGFDEVRFYKKALSVSRAMCMDKNRTDDIQTFFIDNLKYLGEEEFKFYSGKIYVNKLGRKTYLDTMYNGKENETINPVRIEIRNDNSLWLVAGLDKGLIDIHDFVGELMLNKKHKGITNSQKQSEIDGIDYYIYQIVEDQNV